MSEGHEMTEFTVLKGPPDTLPASAKVLCPGGGGWQRSEFSTTQEWLALHYFEVPCPRCGEVLPFDAKPVHNEMIEVARRARELQEEEEG